MIYYKRNLPHYNSPDSIYFITFRLAGSLPVQAISKLKEEQEKSLSLISGYSDLKIRAEKYKENQSIYFVKYDKLLDNAKYGPKWLKDENIANVVKNAIHFYDGKEYNLICFCIMPNHVHLLIKIVEQNSVLLKYNKQDLNVEQNGVLLYKNKCKTELCTADEQNGVLLYPVGNLMQKLKRYTALECNKILKRVGSFWQHESYDHIVRNEEELRKTARYILNNPVKAGLCESPEVWEWSYCNFEKL